MIARTILALGVLALALPARADTTAVYTAGDFGMTTIIEIADTGEVRVQAGGPMFQKVPASTYRITRGGESFFVEETREGARVTRASDIVAVMMELRAGMKRKSGAEESDPLEFDLVARGEQTINGRTGTAFYKRGDDGKAAEPMLVVSHDPVLAQLGREMARSFGSGGDLAARIGVSAIGDSMVKALNGGAPLAYFGLAKLQSVSHDPIPASRFVLPAEPKTLDEVRALMTRKPPAR